MASVSVIAPVYGVEKYIRQFLRSLERQTFRDMEIILVDDGSPDNCPAILDEFAEGHENCRVIHQANAGVSAARNAGLAQAGGEYVYIVDSDDWLDEHAVEKLYAEAKRTGADIIYGDWYSESDDTGESVYQHCFPQAFAADDPETIRVLQCGVFTYNNSIDLHSRHFNAIHHLGGAPWRGMVRMAVIRDNDLKFDPYVRGNGDDILFALHVYEYVHKVAYIQCPIYHYRKVSASYTRGFKANYLESVQRTYERMEDFLREYNKDEMAWSFYYYCVLLYLRQGVERYFLNANNPKSEKERYAQFRQTLQSEPYKTSIQKAPLNMIRSRKRRYGYLLLRLKMARLYWLMMNKK